MAYDYDLFTIGAGSGGVRASRLAAQFGARVAVAEEYRVGGTCVIRGCVPKKLFVYASHFMDEFEDADEYGWDVGDTSFSWQRLIENKDKVIDRLNSIYIRNLKATGAEIIQDRAVLKDQHTIHLVKEGRDVTAETILIATGAWPFIPADFEGSEHVITSNEAFHLETLPNRILVCGGGYIAVEFAGIFNGLGSQTHLLYRGEEILRGFDDDLRAGLHLEMTKKGIEITTGTIVNTIEKEIGPSGDPVFHVTLTDGRTLEFDLVMFATGRVPNSHDLGLEAAGVETDLLGAIKVDTYSKTNVDNIYAVGDVTNRANLTPVAIREGAAFAQTVFNGTPKEVDYTNIPTAVFSQPELGTVGLTEAQAKEQIGEIDIYKTTFGSLKHSMTGRDEKIIMKLIVAADSQQVVGVHLMGPASGEMIQLAGIAVKMGATKEQFDETIAVHPTAAEELVTLKEKWVSPELKAAE